MLFPAFLVRECFCFWISTFLNAVGVSLKINHNVNTLQTVRQLQETAKQVEISQDRLASGVSAKAAVDGGAVVTLTERLRAEVASFNQASENTENAHSLIQVAEQSLVEISEQIRDMRRLAVQAANEGIEHEVSRTTLQHQVEAALTAIDRIARTSTFGQKSLFNGEEAMDAKMTGEGFTFIRGSALTEQDINRPYRVIIRESASQNTTLGSIDFEEVLDHTETIILSEQGRQAKYVVMPGKSAEDNLQGLRQSIAEAKLNLEASLEGGALRIRHAHFGSGNVFRVQSDTPGLLTGGDKVNTQARIRQDVKDGLIERDKRVELLKRFAELGVGVALGTSLIQLALEQTEAYQGLREDLFNAAQSGAESFQQQAAQQLGILSDFDFLVPNKFLLQPHALIRLNQEQLFKFAVAKANENDGLKSLSFADLVERTLGQIDLRVLGEKSDASLGTIQQKMESLNEELSERLAKKLGFELTRGLHILVGKEKSNQLSAVLQTGLPGFFKSLFQNFAHQELLPELTENTSDQELQSLMQERYAEFSEERPQEHLINLIGALHPGLEQGGIPPQDFAESQQRGDDFFVNNGKDVIGYFDEEPGIGEGRLLGGIRRFKGVFLRFDGVVDPGEQAEGTLTITSPGLTFQVGHSPRQTALFGLPDVSSTQLGRNIKNGSSYASLADIELTSTQGAQDAIAILDATNEQITSLRGSLGAFSQALKSNATSLQNLVVGVSDGEQQVADTDYAHELSTMVKQQMIFDTQTAMQAQGNIMPENVLRLLQI